MPTAIDLKTFDGMRPGLEPHLLPERSAQIAHNVRLNHGALEPICDPIEDDRASAAVTEGDGTIYLWRYKTWTAACDEAGEDTPGTWAALADTGGFSISVDDALLQVNPDFTDDTTMAHVAASIQTALQAATGGTDTVAWEDGAFVIRTNGKVTLPGAPGDTDLEDLSAAGWMNAVGTGAETDETENETWLSWPGHVNVVQSPTNGERYGRIYYAGGELERPKMQLCDAGVTSEMDMRILPPAAAPGYSGTSYEDPTGEDPVRDGFTVSGVVAIFTNPYTGAVLSRRGLAYTKDGDKIRVAEQTVSVQHSRTAGAANISWSNVRLAVAVIVNGKDLATNDTVYDTDNEHLLKLVWEQSTYRTSQVVVSEGNLQVAGDQIYRTSLTFTGVCKLVYTTVDTETEEDEDAPTYVSYAYSYVTKYGEEGQLSPASAVAEVVISEGVSVDNILDPEQDDRGITIKRLYRAAGGAFRFLADIALGTTTFEDTTEDADLGESPAADYAPPLDSITGFVALANGVVAAFRENEVWLSEPWMPSAWPVAYSVTAHDQIVALGAQGTDLYVLTRSTPIVMSGSHPDSMSQAIIPLRQPCVSARSVANLANIVVYASNDGLVGLYGGDGRVLTTALYTEFRWQALSPENILGCVHDGRYYAFRTGENALVFAFGEGADALTSIEDDAVAAFSDIVTDTLYLLPAGTGEDTIVKWGQDTANPRTLAWRGREIILSEPQAWAAVRIVAENYDGEDETLPLLTLYRNGVSVLQQRIQSASAVKLPLLPPHRQWSVRVDSLVAVTELQLATSMGAMP